MPGNDASPKPSAALDSELGGSSSQPLHPVPDWADVAAEAAAFEESCTLLLNLGQRLLARIRPSSKYYGQGEKGALFPVVITNSPAHLVKGGPGGKYRLVDVDLFAVFFYDSPPIQITFEIPA